MTAVGALLAAPLGQGKRCPYVIEGLSTANAPPWHDEVWEGDAPAEPWWAEPFAAGL